MINILLVNSLQNLYFYFVFDSLPEIVSRLHLVVDHAQTLAYPAGQIDGNYFALQFEQRLSLAVGIQHRPQLFDSHFLGFFSAIAGKTMHRCWQTVSTQQPIMTFVLFI